MKVKIKSSGSVVDATSTGKKDEHGNMLYVYTSNGDINLVSEIELEIIVSLPPATEKKANQSTSSNNSTKVLGMIALFAICIFVFFILAVKNANQPSGVKSTNNYTEVVDSAKILADKAKLEEQSKWRDSLVRHSIRITSAYLGSPNSAGGVDAFFYYRNLSPKTIKYLVWEGEPINAVGDVVSCEIRGGSVFRGQDTGPIRQGKSSGGCWDCAWYNWTAKKLAIRSVEIEYMDGTTLTIHQGEVKKLFKK